MQFCTPVTGDERAGDIWAMRSRMVAEPDMPFSMLADLVAAPVPPRD